MREKSSLKLRGRQIHLDFHTSPLVPGVGKDFNAEEFAATLKNAHVDSVTCFARCHHGMLYYDSKCFPERIHPNLEHKDMLREMIEACHRAGIKVPVYTTVQWDYYTAMEHPEWLAMDEHGRQIGQEPYEAGFYQTLCVNTGYKEFLKMHIAELLEELDIDGIFLDILYPRDCSCHVRRREMERAGIDVKDPSARLAYAQRMIDDFKREISMFIRSFGKEVSIFYNTSHIGVKQRPVLDAYTHLELESIPGGWGYVHFPVTMRYARTFGLDCVSHTGGFHVEWGDLHSFKTQEALEYECFRMLAMGCKCLVGDQMEADGKLLEPLYEKIGKVYKKVEALEPWCDDAVQVTEAAVLTPEEFHGGDRGHINASLMGLENMFDKLALQFDIIDSRADFGSYPLLILPDNIPVSGRLKEKLDRYLAEGGRVIVTFESGFAEDGEKYMLREETGIEALREPLRTDKGELARGVITNSNDYAEYIMPGDVIGRMLPKTEHVMYAKGVEVARTARDVQVLARFVPPYFYRSYVNFSSHRQAPSTHRLSDPAVIRRGNVIYFASPIFAIYNARAPRWCLEMMKDAILELLGEKIIEHDGPSTLFAALNIQQEKKRFVLHLLHYIPEKIAEDLHTLEDVIPLSSLHLKLNLGKEIRSAALVPEEKSLDIKARDGSVEFTLARLEGYQAIEIMFN